MSTIDLLDIDQLQHLSNATRILSTCRDADELCAQLAANIVAITGISGCMVAQWDAGWDELLLWKTATNPEHPIPIITPVAFPLKESDALRQCVENEEIMEVTLKQSLHEKHELAFMERQHIQRMLIIPLVVHNDRLGLVAVMENDPRRTFGLRERLVAQILVRQATTFLESARLVENLMRYSNEMETIYQASLSLTASLELLTVLDELLRCTISLLPNANNAHIFLFQAGKLKFGAARWQSGQQEKAFAEPRQNGLTYTVAHSGELMMVPDMSTHPLFERTDWKGAIVGLPLKIGARVVGVMNVGFLQPGVVPVSELQLLRLLGEQSAIAIENACLHEQLNQVARTDALTGLPNRRAFDERLLDEVRRARRYDRSFTLALIDLDQFKMINDNHGHSAGDRALQVMAAAMRLSLRDSDFVARYGGDEFAFILPETTEALASQVMARVRADIQQASSAMPEGAPNGINASIGIAIYPQHGESPNDLVLAADKGMYHEKRAHPGSK